MRTLLAVVLLSVPLVASASGPLPTAPPARDSWYAGFGLGTGTGSALMGGRWSSFRELSVDRPRNGFFDLHAGVTLSPRLLLGAQLSGISAMAHEAGVESALSVTSLDAVVTYFPRERGLNFRGGAGWSRFSLTLEGAGVAEKHRKDGANVMVGAGWAFWLGRSFNLSLNVDVFQQWYGSGSADVETSRHAVAYLGFDWY